MDKKAYDILLFSYYRDAELRGADLILRLINRTDNHELQENLTRHLADETNHAWLWTERIRARSAMQWCSFPSAAAKRIEGMSIPMTCSQFISRGRKSGACTDANLPGGRTWSS